MNQSEKLKEVVQYLKDKRIVFNQKDFVIKVRDNPSTVSEYLNGKRNINARFIERVCKEFPMINPNWFAGGEPMILNIMDQPKLDAELTNVDRLLLDNERMEKEIAEYKARMADLYEQIGALKFQLHQKGGDQKNN